MHLLLDGYFGYILRTHTGLLTSNPGAVSIGLLLVYFPPGMATAKRKPPNLLGFSVSRPGFEPGTLCLKGTCSAIELAAQCVYCVFFALLYRHSELSTFYCVESSQSGAVCKVYLASTRKNPSMHVRAIHWVTFLPTSRRRRPTCKLLATL